MRRARRRGGSHTNVIRSPHADVLVSPSLPHIFYVLFAFSSLCLLSSTPFFLFFSASADPLVPLRQTHGSYKGRSTPKIAAPHPDKYLSIKKIFHNTIKLFFHYPEITIQIKRSYIDPVPAHKISVVGLYLFIRPRVQQQTGHRMFLMF